MRPATVVIGAVLALMLSIRSTAQTMLTERYNMTCLDLSAGLPHNHVNHLFADSQGFLWVSTYGGGAVRYDGYSFVKPLLNKNTSMASNSCKGFAEDNYHRLWVAFDEGTVVIDMRTMDSTLPADENGQDRIAHSLQQPSTRVYCDSKGGLWHLTRDSIFRYSFRPDGSVSHISRCGYHGNTPDITISDIEHNGTVWINIENGLYRLAESGDQLVRKAIAPSMSALQDLYVTDLLKRGNAVWISTNQGLFAYDLYTSTLKAYRHTADPRSIAHEFSSSLAVTPEGRLLVGTLRGVDILNEADDTFEHWNAATNGKPMPSDFVNSLLIHNNQIWIGTETAGVIRLSPQSLLLRNYSHEHDNPASLSHNPVNAIYVEAGGTLWVGTVEGGLNRREASGGFTHWTTSNSQLSHNSVSVLEQGAHGRLWIGTWGGGVNSISLTDHSVVSHLDVPIPYRTLTNYIGSLAYDKYNDALWIGSNDGIFLYDLHTGTLSDPFKENRQIRGCIGSHIDKNGQLWIGCLSGVCVIDLRSGKDKSNFKYRHLRYKLNNPESPVIDKICCFCETKDGTLWLGSNGYGLYRRVVDEESGNEHFEVLTTNDGLANNAVKGIVEDDQGRLWITTDNGLSVYDSRTRTFNNYGDHDGLLCQRFYWNSAVKGPDGAIYLGSLNGLTEIRGENAEAQYPVHLTFTRLMVDNQVITADNSGIIDADISQATCIRLHESNKSFAIDFSTLTYAGEAQGHYSYRLKGFENEWTPLNPGEHSVRYTSLKPGSYTLELAYAHGDDQDKEVVSIRVEVVPYFWKSWWFMLIVIMLCVAWGVWYYHRRIELWRQKEAEKLLLPIRKILDESEDAEQLQSRIAHILNNHKRLQSSLHRSVEADKEETMRNSKTFMERATEIMEKNYMNSEFGSAELVESLGMSKSLTAKRLKAETGQSLSQFIRNYRLSIARKLLLENVANRNITEIAYRVGFNDPKYFTRCFTHKYGCSPSAYTGEE
jgi:ligand-binding sensor domain-containing protein/AraC-like DNA-binding protein